MRKVCFGHNLGTCEMHIELSDHEGFKKVGEIKYNEAQKLYHCIVERKLMENAIIINSKVSVTNPIIKRCKNCNSEFIAKYNIQLHCNSKCRNDYRNKNRGYRGKYANI